MALSNNFFNSNSRVETSRIGKVIDSVTSCRRDSTGILPSSPSARVAVEAVALKVRKPAPSGTLIRQEIVRDSFAGTSKACSAFCNARAASRDSRVIASAKVRRAVPCCGLSDRLETLAVNSISSPSRKKRGGFGWHIKSFAVTVSPVSAPERRAVS